MSRLDAAWTTVTNNFSKLLDVSYEHARVFNVLKNSINAPDHPNVLLYGAPGFPLHLYVPALFPGIKSKECQYGKDIFYTENQHYFTFDANNPHQTKDLETLSAFLKSIVSHKSLSGTRHIFVINNIDAVLNKENVYAFRVLLERHSSNAIFIATSHCISNIESPLRSRMLCVRVPLLRSENVATFFQQLSLAPPPDGERDLYRATFLSCVPPEKHESFSWNVHELQSGMPKTLEGIRMLAQKVYVNNISLSALTQDLIKIVGPDIIGPAAHIDALLATTDKHRYSLYIEHLLVIAYRMKKSKK